MNDRATYRLELKFAQDGEAGAFEGVASAYGNVDRGGDIMAPGDAMRDSLATAMDDIVFKGERADKVFKKLLQTILSALLKASLFGNGSFGGLFGGGLFGGLFSGGSGGGGLLGSLLSGLLGGGAQAPLAAVANPGPQVLSGWYHSGGDVGNAPSYSLMPASTFSGALRYHSGLSGGEFPAILQHGERVLTQAQASRTDATIAGLAAAAGSGRSGGNVEVHNYAAGVSVDPQITPHGVAIIVKSAIEQNNRYLPELLQAQQMRR